MLPMHRLPLWGPIALMAATRFHHFGNLQTLPDASLAAFFLAGLLYPQPWLLAVLLAEAGVIDWLAVTFGGVSGWCITPAYAFLVPAYGAMWLGGRRARRRGRAQTARILLLAGVACLTAFAISNAGFYAFSGYFEGLDPLAYAYRIGVYLPSYLTTTLAYLALLLGFRWLWRQATGPHTVLQQGDSPLQ